jgi:hypothetical protein
MKSWCIPKELVQFILNRLSVSKMEFCITAAAPRGKLAEKAGDSLEPEKALFVCWDPFQNRMETQKLTCDLLTSHLKFNFAFFSLEITVTKRHSTHSRSPVLGPCVRVLGALGPPGDTLKQ